MTWWHKWDKKEIARKHAEEWREAKLRRIFLKRGELID